MKIMSDNTIGINRGDELLFDYQIYNGNDIYVFNDGICAGRSGKRRRGQAGRS